ncbi:MAG: NUDIX domain-containing protein [Candidatus Binatia bacterium]
MAHIHTQPGQHDHTASAFIVRIDGDEPRLLLHLHKKLGTLLQFGGHIELHENPWQAVAHEIFEESGYALKQLRLLQPPDRIKVLSGAVLHPSPVCYSTHPFNDDLEHFHTDATFAFVTNEPPQYAISDGESADVRLLTRAARGA